MPFKLKTKTLLFITLVIIIIVFISGIIFQQKQPIKLKQDQATAKQSLPKMTGELEVAPTKKQEESLKDDIMSKVKVEVSVDRLIVDSNNNTKVRLVIWNNSDYQIDKMTLRIRFKDAAGNTVENYDGEILQPITAHGVLGDILWMHAEKVVDQKTSIAINQYSKPLQ